MNPPGAIGIYWALPGLNGGLSISPGACLPPIAVAAIVIRTLRLVVVTSAPEIRAVMRLETRVLPGTAATPAEPDGVRRFREGMARAA